MRLQITHVRPDGNDLDRRIDAVLAGGVAWTVDQVIHAIEYRTASFFVMVHFQSVDVVVRVHSYTGRKYIATRSDGYPPNNLLNLPRF
ncbi:MAG: DUF3892 domain-containing protein [Novosphingobium sp.]|uniref:DUF3892 domain-containing protein n=1 Tax=Novosphingobium sp. TaxID=1874826 RepID=UPI001E19BED3|nr:DUF3892 domain-containing protein [Novosphingobium sp.]MCB2058737.1 DUF3892 domain-containing protein [Novosphingobium sp.]MCP5385934.1 DUF3892 domain-containing protein [Novosphingobium sp.]